MRLLISTVLLFAVRTAELGDIQQNLQFGKYGLALDQANERLVQADVSVDDQKELRRIAGLAAFGLNDLPKAAEHFQALLLLEPDFALDPFVAAPAAVRLFEHQRKELGPKLDDIRKERRDHAEQQRLEADTRRAAEEARRQLEAQTLATSERALKPPLAMHFLPGGLPQFQQGRPISGSIFAALQAGSAIVSLVGFWGYRSLLETRVVVLDDRLTSEGTFTVEERGIPRAQASRANTYAWMQWTGAAAFYASYGLSVAESLWHTHKSHAPTVTLAPSPGGASAQLSLSF